MLRAAARRVTLRRPIARDACFSSALLRLGEPRAGDFVHSPARGARGGKLLDTESRTLNTAPQRMGHVKLHIPGPVEVSTKTFRAFCSPMIGPRGQGLKNLYAKIHRSCRRSLYTKQLVYLSTSSAWGVMEGAIRNLVAKKVLCCMCGAFSDNWLDVAQRCGEKAEGLKVNWGSPIQAEQIEAKLATGKFGRRDP